MSSRPSILITGGTRGIGRACADALAADHHLLIGGRDADQVAAVCAGLPSAEPFVADLMNEQSTADAVEALALEHLDGVVHSAGVSGGWTTPDSSRQKWRDMLEINVIAVSDLTRLLLPALIAARGTIVMVNSGAGLLANGRGGHYPASKFALRALTDVLRQELRPDGVRVCSVHPGRVDTDMQRTMQAEAERSYDPLHHLRPESVATAVRTALTASEDATYETISIRPGPAATNRPGGWV